MAAHRLSIPLAEDAVRSLRIGDIVHLDGKVHTGRAQVYQHVLEGGHEPPLDLASESLAALVIEKVNPNFAREYAKLPDYVLKRIGEIDHSLANEVIVGNPERKG